ncbi:MAG TPA: hypothetical protein VEP90_13890, partial [Methylomirabilota bacterium]|nr:hypothetical protein [Methylomirabilota bacterium]
MKWEERRDRVQRGLYKLAWKLLNQLSQEDPDLSVDIVDLDLDGKIPGYYNSHFLMDIFADPFKNILKPRDFNKLVWSFANGLKEIEVDGSKPFSLEQQKLTMLQGFASLIGDVGDKAGSDNKRQRDIDGIEKFLVQEGTTTLPLVIGGIEKYRNKYGELPRRDKIDTYLYHIFLTRNGEFRSQAAEFLSSSAFFKNIKEDRDRKILDEFLEKETDEHPLGDFIQLVCEEMKNDSQNHDNHEFAIVLLRLLLKPTLPLLIMKEILCRLSEIGDGDDLELVVKSLDRSKDIDEKLLKPLIALSKRSEQNLIKLLLKYGFTA